LKSTRSVKGTDQNLIQKTKANTHAAPEECKEAIWSQISWANFSSNFSCFCNVRRNHKRLNQRFPNG
jgi:hypothetical protein